MPNDEAVEFDLFSQIRRLRDHRKTLIIVAIVGAVLGGAMTFFSRPVWRAETTILFVGDPESSDKDLVAAAAVSPTAPEPLAMLEGVITSKTSIDAVMQATGEDRQTVEDTLTIDRSTRNSQLSISWDDKNDKKAVRAVTSALDRLDELSKTLGFSVAAQQASELKKAVDQKTVELSKAEDELAAYEKTMEAPVDPENLAAAADYLKDRLELQDKVGETEQQLKIAKQQAHDAAKEMDIPSTVDQHSDYRQKLDQLQYQLDLLKTQYGDSAPQVETVRRQLDVTESALRKSVQDYLQSVDKNLDSNVAALEATLITLKWKLVNADRIASKAPQETIELARRLREVKTLETVLETLRGKYEEAKVKAQVEQVRWSVLEPPYIQDKPTNKHYVRSIFGDALILTLLTSFGILLRKRKQA